MWHNEHGTSCELHTGVDDVMTLYLNLKYDLLFRGTALIASLNKKQHYPNVPTSELSRYRAVFVAFALQSFCHSVDVTATALPTQ